MINTMTLNITNNISLKNSFSYREFEISRRFDLDGTTLQILDVINPFKGYTKLRTEEVQLRADFDRVRGVIGYYDEKLNEPYALADRKSVVWGKSVSVRVDLGGRRIIKKKKHTVEV